METIRSYRPQFLTSSPFFIRLRSWEYWPFNLVYLPLFVYYGWLALKARSLFFFSASNPSIETGGLLGESKAGILDLIDDEFKPKTVRVPRSTTIDEVFRLIKTHQLTLPLIGKPDMGERGWLVEKMESQEALINYVQTSPGDFLIQEYVDEPLELGVFYYRMPGQSEGVVSSIVQKEFLSIRGNGHHTVEALIRQNERAILQLAALTQAYGYRFTEIPASGEVIKLVNIGNHCKGTKFLNANHLITPELTRLFDRIGSSIDGFYFGRYDLRCRSVADLYAGRHIKIMELNGAGAEPAHIYQPGFSIWEAYRVLFHHWDMLYQISRENHRRGVPYMGLRDAIRVWKRIRATKLLASNSSINTLKP
jgi:hypothetical protein